jgi:hypothetical protein
MPAKIAYLAESAFGAAAESAFGAAAESVVGAAAESVFGATESVFGASVVAVSPLLQAVNTEATAIAKNTFFICVCLIFKNYNFIFIRQLKKGNPYFCKIFFCLIWVTNYL